MKVAIVAPSSVPFMLGGAERAWNGMIRAINEQTPHDAELIKLPTRERNLFEVVESYRMWAGLDLSHFDMVISTKYPAWMVNHPNHVVHMQHTLRGLYDTYPRDLPEVQPFTEPSLVALQDALARAGGRSALAELFELFDTAVAAVGPGHAAFAFPGPLARALVHAFDRIGLAPGAIRRHYAISATVAARRDYFPPGVIATPLLHGSDLVDYRCEGFDYFFTASRLDPPKRIDMLIDAMAYVSGDVRLLIAGTGPESERLHAMASGDSRIDFLGYVSSEELLDLYANALAVPFVPVDEDLGLITVEAMMSGKPVVTTRDSGGPTELVADGASGFVVEPTAEALGGALARLADDKALALRLGAAGRLRAEAFSWERVVTTLMGDGAGSSSGGGAGGASGVGSAGRRVNRPAPRARRIVVVSTFPIHPRQGGGQLRSFYLYRALADRYDVEAVSLTGPLDARQEFELAERFYETSVPKSARHEAEEQALGRQVGVPITDIAASLLFRRTPAYLAALRRACAGTDAVLLAHPFLLPAVTEVAPDVPVVYDAHNAEFSLKRALLPDTEAGTRLLDAVIQVEGDACRNAVVVSVCSTEDAVTLGTQYGLDRAKTELVPNGVDSSSIPFVTGTERAAAKERWLGQYRRLSGLDELRHVAMFTGSWHLPNIDAGHHVIEIANQLPDVLFALVGGHCSEFDRWWLPPNVVLMGVVSDAAKDAMLACADVALNPMVRGSGTNLKVVEYFAAGVPVVSTRLGSRGLSVEPGVHLSVAELAQFPSAIRAVLDDPAGASSMAHEARRMVETKYDWRVSAGHLLDRLTASLPERRRFSAMTA